MLPLANPPIGPAIGVVPPVTVYVIEVEFGIVATTTLVGLPPYNLPVLFSTADIVSPTVKPVVVDMPVIVAVQGPVPVIVPIVPVELISVGVVNVVVIFVPLGVLASSTLVIVQFIVSLTMPLNIAPYVRAPVKLAIAPALSAATT